MRSLSDERDLIRLHLWGNVNTLSWCFRYQYVSSLFLSLKGVGRGFSHFMPHVHLSKPFLGSQPLLKQAAAVEVACSRWLAACIWMIIDYDYFSDN